ncbi:hypothetical protein ACIOJD_19795 [Streptomyces sp. NPDC088116]|uniref:hypothetical protein n=1 Tax=Streptomyces sp. NPDC088116 TaxID=3365825 RepID=UPI00381D794E
MIWDHRHSTGVVCLDLRHRGDPAAERDALLDVVTEALARTRASEARRFLVLDDAAELAAHQLLYERLYSYGPARLLCLAVDGQDEGKLLRPLALGPPAAGVLWIPEAFAGAGAGAGHGPGPGPGHGPGHGHGPGPGPGAGPHEGHALSASEAETDAALRPLVELLAEPSVFDTVLGELKHVQHGVAVPAVRVLEHDLTEVARTRAWRQALEQLIGQEISTPALVTEGAPGTGPGSGDAVPAQLAPLIGHALPRSLEGRSWLVPGGPAEKRQLACDRALRDTEDGYEQVRRATGLFQPRSRSVDLPERLERLADELGDYRDTIAGALSDGGGDRLRPEQRARLLKRGIDLPEIAEASRGTVGPGLRTYTERLIAYGLPLRSVAARLGALSDLSAPAGSAARLARLDEICSPRRLRELASPVPFALKGSLSVHAAPVFLLALVAGLWPVFGWALGPLTGLAAAGATLFMLRRRPNRSYDGRLDGGGSTRSGIRLLAGLVGGVLGALAGQLLGLPPWAGATALCVALAALVLLVLRDWTAAVDLWWSRTDGEWAARALADIDDLLAETAVHDWLFADARYHCSDGARAVARLVRNLAETAEERLDAAAPDGTGAWESEAAAPAAGPVGGEPWDAGRSEAEPWSWETWGDSAADDDWAGSMTPAEPARAAPEPEPAGDEAHRYGSAAPREQTGTALEYDVSAGSWPSAPPVDPPWLERERGDGGPALAGTLLGDLADGVSGILATRWATVENNPAEAGRASLRAPMAEVLEEEHAALLRNGATSPPRFARDPGQRPGAAELLGVSADRVGQLLGPDGGADGDEAVPLCAAGHRRMLSKDPAAIRQIRFAPEAMRRGTEADLPHDGWHATGEDVVWTPGGRHAGVLRLVPLRGEIVLTVRGDQGEGS